MQITLDLPDDVYRDAQAMAKQQSRSLASVVLELIRSARTLPSQPRLTTPEKSETLWQLPVVQAVPPLAGAEAAHMLEVNGPPSGPLAMLGYARQFQTGAIPSTDEIMRELRAGDRD